MHIALHSIEVDSGVDKLSIKSVASLLHIWTRAMRILTRQGNVFKMHRSRCPDSMACSENICLGSRKLSSSERLWISAKICERIENPMRSKAEKLGFEATKTFRLTAAFKVSFSLIHAEVLGDLKTLKNLLVNQWNCANSRAWYRKHFALAHSHVSLACRCTNNDLECERHKGEAGEAIKLNRLRSESRTHSCVCRGGLKREFCNSLCAMWKVTKAFWPANMLRCVALIYFARCRFADLQICSCRKVKESRNAELREISHGWWCNDFVGESAS